MDRPHALLLPVRRSLTLAVWNSLSTLILTFNFQYIKKNKKERKWFVLFMKRQHGEVKDIDSEQISARGCVCELHFFCRFTADNKTIPSFW